ncbi:Uncharacterized protein HZ326_15394 [Fusarium oxysporum f. sp. albedinis]|nr:Uncharacterized protein HZ326_15394 [Fusarium oxysporum f. sp. albedinis]
MLHIHIGWWFLEALHRSTLDSSIARVFRGLVGYGISLTPRRSPVRSRAEPYFCGSDRIRVSFSLTAHNSANLDPNLFSPGISIGLVA